MTIEEMFATLEGFIDERFIDGAICVGGYNRQTAERILYYHTGWDNFEDFSNGYEYIQKREVTPNGKE